MHKQNFLEDLIICTIGSTGAGMLFGTVTSSIIGAITGLVVKELTVFIINKLKNFKK